jgi:predicted metal-binding membrane protein
LAEKLLAVGPRMARLSGVLLIVAGAYLLMGNT